MNVKRSFHSRPPRRQKTKEKLKNPQQPNTQALESQEGLKLWTKAISDGAAHRP
jgi:hypothetical protein